MIEILCRLFGHRWKKATFGAGLERGFFCKWCGKIRLKEKAD